MRGGAGKDQGGASGRSGREWAGRGRGQRRARGGASGDGAGPQGLGGAKGGAVGPGCRARHCDLGPHWCRGMSGVGPKPYRKTVKGGNVRPFSLVSEHP